MDGMTFEEFRALFVREEGAVEMFNSADFQMWQAYHYQKNSEFTTEHNRAVVELNRALLESTARQNELLAEVVALLRAKGGTP